MLFFLRIYPSDTQCFEGSRRINAHLVQHSVTVDFGVV